MSNKLRTTNGAIILGLDMGNFNIKTSTGKIYPAYYNKANMNTVALNQNKKAMTIITDDDKAYTIGDGDFDTEYMKADKETLPLFLLALANEIPSNKLAATFRIVVGLPYTQWKDGKDRIIKYYKGTHTFWVGERYEMKNDKQVEIEKNKRIIKVEEVQCFPEGFGASFTVKSKYPEFLLLDFGGRTTNVIYLEDGQLQDGNTLEQGSIKLLMDVKEYIEKNFKTTNVSLKKAERWLKSGRYIHFPNGQEEEVDLKPVIEQLKADVIEDIKGSLRVKIDFASTPVYVTGGGALTFKEAILKEIPHAKFLEEEDSLFANAKGFKMVGASYWANV